jgi:hypothetical protein
MTQNWWCHFIYYCWLLFLILIFTIYESELFILLHLFLSQMTSLGLLIFIFMTQNWCHFIYYCWLLFLILIFWHLFLTRCCLGWLIWVWIDDVIFIYFIYYCWLLFFNFLIFTIYESDFFKFYCIYFWCF